VRFSTSRLAVLLVLCACGRAGDNTRALPAADSAAPDPTAAIDAASLARPEPVPAVAAPPQCFDEHDVHLFMTPSAAWTGAGLRAIAFTDRPAVGTIRITPLAKGKPTDAAITSELRHGGPPYFWITEIPKPRAGTYAVSFVQTACGPDQHVAARTVSVGAAPTRLAAPEKGLWPSRAAWTHRFEELYSVWIETLFDAPDDEMPSWPALHEVLRDRARNLLESLPSIFGVEKPLVPRSTMKPRITPSSFAHTTATSAIGELVIHILAPVSDSRPAPSRRACHRAGIGAVVRLGQAEAADDLAGRELRQVFLAAAPPSRRR
jgi:hypothetical protein